MSRPHSWKRRIAVAVAVSVVMYLYTRVSGNAFPAMLTAAACLIVSFVLGWAYDNHNNQLHQLLDGYGYRVPFWQKKHYEGAVKFIEEKNLTDSSISACAREAKKYLEWSHFFILCCFLNVTALAFS